MFSLLDLRFVLCSRSDLDVLRVQRSMGFFYYPQINKVRKSRSHRAVEMYQTQVSPIKNILAVIILGTKSVQRTWATEQSLVRDKTDTRCVLAKFV